MANKNQKHSDMLQEHRRKVKEQQYEKAMKKLFVYPVVTIVISVMVMLLFFVSFAEVYNGTVVEVKVSGLAFVISGITGNFTSPDTIYGDMAMPFYYYAGQWCETVATFALLAMVVIVVNLILQIIVTARKIYVLNWVSAALSVLTAVLLIICFAQGLAMKDGKILSVYCNNNPLCVIRSYAIIPAIVALIGCAVSVFGVLQYMKVKKSHK